MHKKQFCSVSLVCLDSPLCSKLDRLRYVNPDPTDLRRAPTRDLSVLSTQIWQPLKNSPSPELPELRPKSGKFRNRQSPQRLLELQGATGKFPVASGSSQ